MCPVSPLASHSPVTPEVEQALRQASEVWLTTYDLDGNPGSVPIWFIYTEGRVYVATGRTSKKVLKLQANRDVGIRVSRSKIALVGSGRLRSDPALVHRVAPVLNSKYNGAWGEDAGMVDRLLDGDIVLLEITPSR